MGSKVRKPESYPLYLQFPHEALDDVSLAVKTKYDFAAASRASVSTPEVEAAYGRAAIASLQLHHVLTDFAVAITDEVPSSLIKETAGPLRSYILRAAAAERYSELTPYLLGWDHHLGEQSIKYRNHVIHTQLWSSDGADRIGRIENGRYTEWTAERLAHVTSRIHWSFLALNQIFWDVLVARFSDAGLVRVSRDHHFYAQQQHKFMDSRHLLSFLESRSSRPPAPSAEGTL